MLIAKQDLPFLGFVATSLTVRALPASIRLRWLGWVASTMGDLWYGLDRSGAALTRDNLLLAFGDEWSNAQVVDTARAVFRHVVLRTLMQDIVVDLSAAEVTSFLALEGQNNLDTALAGGRGVVFVGTHFGPQGYLPLMSLVSRGYPITAVLGEEMEPDSSWVYQHLVYPFRKRSRHLFEIIRPSQMPQMEMVKALRQNRILLTLGDALDHETFHLAPPNVLPVSFRGHKLPLKTGPIRLARWLGVPLVPFSMAPRAGGRFTLTIEPALPLSPDRSTVGLQADLTAYWARFEPYLLRYPELWAHWRHERMTDLFRMAEAQGASLMTAAEVVRPLVRN